jgi:hypothetical protein
MVAAGDVPLLTFDPGVFAEHVLFANGLQQTGDRSSPSRTIFVEN